MCVCGGGGGWSNWKGYIKSFIDLWVFKLSHAQARACLAKLISKTNVHVYEGHFFMFVESGCISTNIEFTVP